MKADILIDFLTFPLLIIEKHTVDVIKRNKRDFYFSFLNIHLLTCAIRGRVEGYVVMVVSPVLFSRLTYASPLRQVFTRFFC